METTPKQTDHGPLDPKLQPEGGPNPAAQAYPNTDAAQDLEKKHDSEEPRGAGGV